MCRADQDTICGQAVVVRLYDYQTRVLMQAIRRLSLQNFSSSDALDRLEYSFRPNGANITRVDPSAGDCATELLDSSLAIKSPASSPFL
jgi:hypothetical protein